MEEKRISKHSMKIFVLVSKVLPMILALFHFLNCILSYFDLNTIIINYITSISLLTVLYLYFVSYFLKLCEYYRIYLHYCVIIDLLNIYDYYYQIPIDDKGMVSIYVAITIITLFLIIYLKFFK